MPKVGYEHTVEARRKISEALKGKPVWNKGLKGTQGANKGSFKKGEYRYPETGFKKGIIPYSKKVAGKGILVAWNKGKKTPEEVIEKQRGENHWNWKGGKEKWKQPPRAYKNIYARRYKLRKKSIVGSHTFAEWELLKKQYGYTCPCCHRPEPEIKLTADHIIPITKGGSDFIENIQPLCQSCNSRKNTKIIKYEYEPSE